jgi:hypothetical protein
MEGYAKPVRMGVDLIGVANEQRSVPLI